MFFKREKPKVFTFSDRVSMLRDAGFQVAGGPGGTTRATRNGCAADLAEASAGTAEIRHCGVAIGNEIGLLTDLGYQKIFKTESGKIVPARAEHLKALHAFNEDLREALGLTSLYNEGLGTTNELHLYDRVLDRDQAPSPHPWARK